MITINANAGEILTSPVDYLNSNGYAFTGYNSNSWQECRIDRTNKYLYLVSSIASPRMQIDRYTYDGNGNLTNLVTLTLSWFTWLANWVKFFWFQGSHSWNFFIYVDLNGSGALATGNVYPVTISGTTATLGAAITPPTVASYTMTRVFAAGANVYARYRSGSNVVDTWRKRNGSTWATLSGVALPSSVETCTMTNDSDRARQTLCPVGTSNTLHYIGFDSGLLKFNTATDTRSLPEFRTRGVAYMVADVNGYLRLTPSWPRGRLYYPNWTTIKVVGLWSTKRGVMDLLGWIIRDNPMTQVQNPTLHDFYKWANKRIRRILTWWHLVYSLDNGTTWAYLQRVNSAQVDSILNFAAISSTLIVVSIDAVAEID